MSQGVKKGTFVVLDDVEDETFLVEKQVRRATVAESDANSTIKPFARGGNVDRCKSPNLLSSGIETKSTSNIIKTAQTSL